MTTGCLKLGTNWGPFSPVYTGISHILDAAQGSMTDLALFTGRREPASVILPDTIFDYVQNVKSGVRLATVRVVPEDVATDYSSFSLRNYLDPHGDTALAKFTVESDERMRCEITFRNASDENREYFYGLGLSVVDARRKVSLKKVLRSWWLPAKDYTAIEAYQKAFGLGCRQCLSRVFSWGVESEMLAQAFGGWEGDRVSYHTTLPKPVQDGYVYFRYIKYSAMSQRWELRINGNATAFCFPQTWEIPGGLWGKNRDAYEEWRLLRVPIGRVSEADLNIELRPLEAPGNDTARIWLDGMLFNEGRLPGDKGASELLPTLLVDEPRRDDARVELASSDGSTVQFRIILQDEPERIETVLLEGMTPQARSGNGSFLAHLRKRFELPAALLERDSTVSPWGAADSDPITVPAHSERTVGFTLCMDRPTANSLVEDEGTVLPSRTSPPQGPYSEMAARLRDVLLFNVNYPMKLFGAPSPYYVPSKYFPLPYSWDGGLTAVGMTTFAPGLALQQASYFFTGEEQDFPCLYCGSPVPTPLYALWEVYQATQDRSALAGAYAGAKRMYDFYLGRTPGSVVNAHNDGMLSTYPYNYNLGIDDHPIQRWAEEQKLTDKGVYSLILMAQMLRMARMLRNMAYVLEKGADAEQYRCDSELLGGIIDNQMWDEKSGLYGWLCRTEQGVEPLLLDGSAGDPSGCAFLPLFAGLTTHKERLIKQLMDQARFLTPWGISSVDMTAPCYNPKGYWNGGIWPVMQWYIWRGLLESGEPVLARKVAELILNTWQQFFDKDHYLGEHYMIEPAQMNGAPNFGGLSAVLLPMCAAYYTAYQVTPCYDVIIMKQSVDPVSDTLSLTLSAPYLSAAKHDLLVNMGKGKTQYACIVNGQLLGEYTSDDYGHLSLQLPRPSGQDEVVIRRKS
ncbi:MAG: trehalase family glycosidase [bacterium]